MDIDQSLYLEEDGIIDRITLWAATLLFILTIVLAATQVVVRTFNIPIQITWTESMARGVFIVCTFIGAGVASRNEEHISFNFFLDRWSAYYPRFMQFLSVLSSMIVVVFLLIAVSATLLSAESNWNATMGSGLTFGWVFIGISLGLAIMIYYEARILIKELNPMIDMVTATIRRVTDKNWGEQ